MRKVHDDDSCASWHVSPRFDREIISVEHELPSVRRECLWRLPCLIDVDKLCILRSVKLHSHITFQET